MDQSAVFDLIVGGSPYALLLVAVWWFNGKLVQTEQRLYDRDEKHSKETEKYTEIIRDLAGKLAENTVALNDNKILMTACRHLVERIEPILIENRHARTTHETGRNVD